MNLQKNLMHQRLNFSIALHCLQKHMQSSTQQLSIRLSNMVHQECIVRRSLHISCIALSKTSLSVRRSFHSAFQSFPPTLFVR